MLGSNDRNGIFRAARADKNQASAQQQTFIMLDNRLGWVVAPHNKSNFLAATAGTQLRDRSMARCSLVLFHATLLQHFRHKYACWPWPWPLQVTSRHSLQSRTVLVWHHDFILLLIHPCKQCLNLGFRQDVRCSCQPSFLPLLHICLLSICRCADTTWDRRDGYHQHWATWELAPS